MFTSFQKSFKLFLVYASFGGYKRIQLLICSYLQQRKKISWGYEIACVCNGRDTSLFKCWLSQECAYSRHALRRVPLFTDQSER